MYDMYYWDEPEQAELNGAERPSRPVRGIRHPRRPAHGPAHPDPEGTGTGAGAPGPAARAVQVALDRRDNGGDASARRDQ